MPSIYLLLLSLSLLLSPFALKLQTSSTTEEQRQGGSPSLRRSPRIDEMDHYEERWRQSEEASHSTSQPPSISVQQPDTAPWRDQYGLLMEGISDFYDFTASVNPSRSRPSSRNASPQPRNVANLMDVDEEHTLEVYDDSQDGLITGELNCELVLQMLETTLTGNEIQVEQLQLQNVADDVKNGNGINQMVTMAYESPDERRPSRSRSRSQPLSVTELEESIQEKDQLAIDHCTPMEVETIDEAERHISPMLEVSLPQPVIEINDMVDEQMDNSEPTPTREEMRLFVETLRAERNSRSRSRSRCRSPLPSSDNIARSLETRRQKRIKQNDELFEKLQDEERQRSNSTSPVPVVEQIIAPTPPPVPTISIEFTEEQPLEEDKEPEDTPESMARLFEQLRLNRVRSHSRSRSRSPLPSAANLEHSLQKRREKLIAQNDAFFEQLQEGAKTPEPEVRVIVEHVYEYVESNEFETESRDMRSLSPSRSRSMSAGSASGSEDEDSHQFHLMLNLEGSEGRTLRKNSEELESVLANNAKQREVDLEALQKLSNANEEMEIRLMTPPKSDYERTFSEAARDLKDEIMVSGFKRSTYVGESLDLASELEQQHQVSAEVQRSHSISPCLDMDEAREQAAAQRELQAAILNSLVTASDASGADSEKRLGAKPKTNEYERTRCGDCGATVGGRARAQIECNRERTGRGSSHLGAVTSIGSQQNGSGEETKVN